MMLDIKQIRKSLTAIELEAGQKHPAKPDHRLMKREAEEVEYLAKKIRKEISDLYEF